MDLEKKEEKKEILPIKSLSREIENLLVKKENLLDVKLEVNRLREKRIATDFLSGRLSCLKKVRETEEKEDQLYLKTFLTENNTDVLPEIINKEINGVSWKLIFTYNTCDNPTDKGFFFLTPRQLDTWREVFLSISDTTEYQAAIQLTNSWNNWKFLKENNPLFARKVSEWQEEIEKRKQSASFEQISVLAENGDFQANKFILTEDEKEEKREVNNKRVSLDYTLLQERGLIIND